MDVSSDLFSLVGSLGRYGDRMLRRSSYILQTQEGPFSSVRVRANQVTTLSL